MFDLSNCLICFCHLNCVYIYIYIVLYQLILFSKSPFFGELNIWEVGVQKRSFFLLSEIFRIHRGSKKRRRNKNPFGGFGGEDLLLLKDREPPFFSPSFSQIQGYVEKVTNKDLLKCIPWQRRGEVFGGKVSQR